MSVDVFRPPSLETVPNTVEIARTQVSRTEHGWSPERFAQEQIRGLVRQIFFSNAVHPVRQVIFSAVEEQTDLAPICERVGKCLASETKGSVGVLTRDSAQQEEDAVGETSSANCPRPIKTASLPLRETGRHISDNLWLLTESDIVNSRNELVTPTAVYARLCELRAEFEHSIVEGPPAGQSSQAAAFAQITDGIVLVLVAHETRRAAALKVKEMLESTRTRILGAVLTERTFPIPDALYRRL